MLRNVYAVIVVSPSQHPHVHHEAARRFAAYLLSPEARAAIARFGVAEYGEPLFFPPSERDGNPEPEATR